MAPGKVKKEWQYGYQFSAFLIISIALFSYLIFIFPTISHYIYLSIYLSLSHTLFLSPFSYLSVSSSLNLCLRLSLFPSFFFSLPTSRCLFLSLFLHLLLSISVSMQWIGLQELCQKVRRTAWYQSERRVIRGLKASKYELNYQSASCESVVLTEVDLIYMMMGKALSCGKQGDVLNDYQSIWKDGNEVRQTSEDNFL